MKIGLKKTLGDENGASLVLFSLMLPLVLVLLAGCIIYAYWLSDKSTVQNAADTWYAGWTCNSATANFGTGNSGLCTTLPTT